MEFGFGFCCRDVSDGLRQAPGIEPVDPFEGGVFDGVEAAPGATAVDDVDERHEEPWHGVIVSDGRSWSDEVSRVHAQDWFELRTPTLGALRKVYDMRKEFRES